MKRIGQLFILPFATLSFVAVAFGGECDIYCDDVQPSYEIYHECERDCKDKCKGDSDPNCKSDCLKYECKYDYDNRQYNVGVCSDCNRVEALLTNVKQSCPDLSPVLYNTCENVDVSRCCWTNGWNPSCTGENNTGCTNPPVSGACASGFNLEGDCCVQIPSEGSGECTNPPVSGACASGFNLEGACCIAIPCEELNADDKAKCDARGKSGEAVIWDNNSCSCVCNPAAGCCGVQLNIPIPFIGDCIELTSSNNLNGGTAGTLTVNQLNAFPYLIQGISKILVTLIMIFSVIIVIVAGLMMTTSVASESNYKKGTDMLQKVIIALILLGTSGLILKLINPTFFGG